MAEVVVIYTFAQQMVVVGLLAHMLYYRPHRTSLWFLGTVLPFATMYDPTIYEFHRMEGMPIGVFESWCPIVNMLGFLFVYYVAFSLTTGFVRMRRGQTARYSEYVITSILFFVMIGVCMEILNESLGWWKLKTPSDIFAYVGMWIWRPAMSFPIFFAALVENRRERRRLMVATVGLAVSWMAGIVYVRTAGLPAVYDIICASIIFLMPLTVWIGSRIGWLKGDIALGDVQYTSPRFVFHRDDSVHRPTTA